VTRPIPVAAVVLAAFMATTAVPGPQVVAHRHAGGDHDHVHAFLVHGDDDHDHAHHHHHHDAEAAHARRHRSHAHRPRVSHGTADPLHHAHVVSPFQPATPPATPHVELALHVTTGRPAALPVVPALALERIRSRGPPPLARF